MTGCSRMAAMIFSMPGSCRPRAFGVGRAVPAAEVSCLVAQLGCQQYGGEFADLTVAGRPDPVIQIAEKQPFLS
jgi:hypothetical protein